MNPPKKYCKNIISILKRFSSNFDNNDFDFTSVVDSRQDLELLIKIYFARGITISDQK